MVTDLEALSVFPIRPVGLRDAIARGFIAPSGIELTCVPAFADIEINGEERTAIRLLVEPRDMHR